MRYYTDGEILKALRERIDAKSQKEVAVALGFSPQFLNDVLGNRRNLTSQLASALGFHECPRRFTRKSETV
jgi:plasmid maintenance system antidote protein VapI